MTNLAHDNSNQPDPKKNQPTATPQLVKMPPLNPLETADLSPELRKSLNELLAKEYNPTAEADRVVLKRLPSGVAVIELGLPHETAVVFNEARMESLARAVVELSKDMPKGLIIAGPHPKMFCAGADINVIKDLTDPEVGYQLARKGQLLFDMIAKMPCKKVAAISGPCVGGGAELAITANYRIMTEAPGTVIGFPEVTLGILPGFGGTQRLPGIVGFEGALKLILPIPPALLKAKEAQKMGLVDEVVKPEALVARAEEILLGKNLPKKKKFSMQEKIPSGQGLLGSILRKAPIVPVKVKGKWKAMSAEGLSLAQIEKGDPHGHFPAVREARKAVLYGMRHGIDKGLEYEARKLGELVTSQKSKDCQHAFYFLTEKSKALGKASAVSMDHVKAGVIGAGVMGGGIGTHMARCGHRVNLQDLNKEALQKVVDANRDAIMGSRSLTPEQKEEKIGLLEATSGSDAAWIRDADIVVEAIVEKMAVKKKVFGDWAKKVGPNCILASNTSSLRISEIAEGIPNPERVVGMHFFNPVSKMMLVEIIRGEKTSDEVVAKVAALAVQMGKFPIVVEDRSGFVVNRILAPEMNEAMYLLRDGYTIDEIDKAALKFGMQMGPLRTVDEVGFDIAAHVGEELFAAYGGGIDPSDVTFLRGTFAKLQERGMLGRKQGGGFYTYRDEKDTRGKANPAISEILDVTPTTGKKDMALVEKRLIFSLINEAVRTMDEGVAGAPGRTAAEQIDLASIIGFGFAPARGGLIHYAESLGAYEVLKQLRLLEERYPYNEKDGSRFTPAPGIVKRALAGKSFYEAI